jgi:uncharacterized membrane protein YuzA (DUF378 family)
MRGGHTLLMGPAMILPLVALVREPWARRAMQALLVVGALFWLSTSVELVNARLDQGRPWQRLALILAGVSAFYLLAAVLLQGKRMGAFYGAQAAATGAPPPGPPGGGGDGGHLDAGPGPGSDDDAPGCRPGPDDGGGGGPAPGPHDGGGGPGPGSGPDDDAPGRRFGPVGGGAGLPGPDDGGGGQRDAGTGRAPG